MTCEEMEAYYVITLSQDQKEPIEVEADSQTDENLEAMPVTYDPVGLDRYEQSVEVSKNDTLVDRESLRLAARCGMVWSIILEEPKGLLDDTYKVRYSIGVLYGNRIIKKSCHSGYSNPDDSSFSYTYL